MYSGKAPFSVLLISSSNKGELMIKELLDGQKYNPIRVVSTGNEARRLLLNYNYDIIIINTPLSDEFGDELAIHASGLDVVGVVILVKQEMFDEVSNKVTFDGVLTISKPIYRQTFEQGFMSLEVLSHKMTRLVNENKKLLIKLEELRIVSRAKCLLIEFKKISEIEAHRYIEKQAMDERLSKKVIAEGIIKFYTT